MFISVHYIGLYIINERTQRVNYGSEFVNCEVKCNLEGLVGVLKVMLIHS